ncbi:YjjI family glycine radical enzyme [Pelagibaculum spongiae]|uniref:YjjI family glycine radical enzyme n=1 Tax=Pelagibaculum spongiae TaxID=2080658 RepID=A0A2V1GYF8_9GAMM|nr:YjjI family glycine radical enzyme [Pelagibaculum spongiae]PVZ65690.1 YjjI family glycine radical enzyme [Pelagibaculum spongiae]
MSQQTRLRQIANDPKLSYAQKSRYLSLEADGMLDYPQLPQAARQAMDQGMICDLFEGHAPFKPRYVLPDYEKALQQGSKWLELEPPQDLDEAINFLLVLYHHVPSVTNLPVSVGRLDVLLEPYLDQSISQAQLEKKIRLMWQMIDRTLPDAFIHANIGPHDSRVGRAVLKVDGELAQVAPNLTMRYQAGITPDDMLQQAVENICKCNKPHIANEAMIAKDFDEKGFGIVSCYNSLPYAGGAHTLVRLNLKQVAEMSDGTETDFLQRAIPLACQWMYQVIDARIDYLVNQSNFYQSSFLVAEGLIDPERFTAMFGTFGLAEATNYLIQASGQQGRYGHDQQANQLALRITQALAEIVETTPVKHCWRERAMFHAQSGISIDTDTSAGCRIPYGEEPDNLQHILTVLPHHKYFTAGISDIFPIDETIEQNLQALMTVCKGALDQGLRMFTANVANNELIRVTGYMVRRSDIKNMQEKGSRINSSAFGAEAVEKCNILQRNARVISQEMHPFFNGSDDAR